MTTLEQAARQALEALEVVIADVKSTPTAYEAQRQALVSLRQAIEQAEQQEPVAWLFQHEDTGLTDCVDVQQVEWGFEKNNPRWQKVAPLYTTPPHRKWVGLTDEEIGLLTTGAGWSHLETPALLLFARAIEAAHGIGEVK